jgi:endonuclease-3
VADARAALTALPGIGPKTASCVLLFSLGIPAMPVDTHVHRVALRTGMIASGTSAEAAHEILESGLSGSLNRVYSFHVNTIRHGRDICKARTPLCGQCCLNDLCDFYSRLEP